MGHNAFKGRAKPDPRFKNIRSMSGAQPTFDAERPLVTKT